MNTDTGGQLLTSPLGVFRGLLSPQTSEDDADVGARNDVIDPNLPDDDDNEYSQLPVVHMDPLELCLLIVDVIKAICRLEYSRRPLTTRLTSGVVLEHARELLPALQSQFCATDTHPKTSQIPLGWSESDCIRVQRHLVHLLLTAMKTIAMQSNGCALLRDAHSVTLCSRLCLQVRQELEKTSRSLRSVRAWLT